MKKVYLSLIALLGITAAANAQLQKGNVLVGGDLANFSIGLKKGSITNLNLTPKAAWFVSNNFAVGAYVNFGLTTAKNAGTVVTYGVGPLARYYINDPKVNILKHGRFFGEANAGIGGQNASGGGGSTNGLDLGIGPGYAYFITPNVGLETLLKLNGNVGFGNETSTSRLALNVGFQIYLPGRATRNRVMNEERK